MTTLETAPPITLLVACQNLYALVDGITSQPGGFVAVVACGIDHLGCMQLMSEARAAIAKAEEGNE